MEPNTANDAHLTGTRLELTMELAFPLEAFWEMVQDVTRIGEWSPECIAATWADAPVAAVGAHFRARNRFPDGAVRGVDGVVTERVEPTSFEWVVLDQLGFAGSIWRYDLSPGARPKTTTVRHRFEHGPGETGLRVGVRADPMALPRRLSQLAANMSGTLLAMERQWSETVVAR